MKQILSLLFVISAITAGVYLGSCFYYGTWDLFDLSISAKEDIFLIWLTAFGVYWFLLRDDD